MSKRAGDHDHGPLKGGHRPDAMDIDDKVEDGMGEFEDEFEDEFESEDEIFEAGVDGRPDAEREAEEKAGRLIAPTAPPRRKHVKRGRWGEARRDNKTLWPAWLMIVRMSSCR